MLLNSTKLSFQYEALATTFEKAYAKDRTDYTAKELAKLLRTPQYRALLYFMFPILKDMRRITKMFQFKTGSNLDIYEELKSFITTIAQRFLKQVVIQRNNIYQLMDLDVTTEFNVLKLEDVNFGTTFEKELAKFDRKTQFELRTFGREYLRTLFMELQKKLSTLLRTLR